MLHPDHPFIQLIPALTGCALDRSRILASASQTSYSAWNASIVSPDSSLSALNLNIYRTPVQASFAYFPIPVPRRSCEFRHSLVPTTPYFTISSRFFPASFQRLGLGRLAFIDSTTLRNSPHICETRHLRIYGQPMPSPK